MSELLEEGLGKPLTAEEIGRALRNGWNERKGMEEAVERLLQVTRQPAWTVVQTDGEAWATVYFLVGSAVHIIRGMDKKGTPDSEKVSEIEMPGVEECNYRVVPIDPTACFTCDVTRTVGLERPHVNCVTRWRFNINPHYEIEVESRDPPAPKTSSDAPEGPEVEQVKQAGVFALALADEITRKHSRSYLARLADAVEDLAGASGSRSQA